MLFDKRIYFRTFREDGNNGFSDSSCNFVNGVLIKRVAGGNQYLSILDSNRENLPTIDESGGKIFK